MQYVMVTHRRGEGAGRRPARAAPRSPPAGRGTSTQVDGLRRRRAAHRAAGRRQRPRRRPARAQPRARHAWFQNQDEWAAMPADDGPDDWQRIDVAVDESQEAPSANRRGRRPRQSTHRVDVGRAAGQAIDAGRARPRSTVSNVEIGEQSLSFDVDQVGVPVLVKVSYFPNWEASGAEGPYRVGAEPDGGHAHRAPTSSMTLRPLDAATSPSCVITLIGIVAADRRPAEGDVVPLPESSRAPGWPGARRQRSLPALSGCAVRREYGDDDRRLRHRPGAAGRSPTAGGDLGDDAPERWTTTVGRRSPRRTVSDVGPTERRR